MELACTTCMRFRGQLDLWVQMKNRDHSSGIDTRNNPEADFGDLLSRKAWLFDRHIKAYFRFAGVCIGVGTVC